MDGFSDRLLPSDRWQWSDVTGLQHQPLDGFQLPSENWEWETDWYVDENFGGEPTEKGVSEHAGSAADALIAVAHLMLVCRVGRMLLIFRPLTLKTRSGTLACAAADGYATGGTSHKTPGLRCVLLGLICFILFGLSQVVAYSPSLLCVIRSPQSRRVPCQTHLMI